MKHKYKVITEENVGGIDLVLRALIGCLLTLMLALDVFSGWIEIVVSIIAFFGLYTSITRHCTVYSFLGINTIRDDS